MKEQSLKIQTAVMTGCNMVIRGLGFILRMITARLLGPEAVGVMELAGQAHMLALTPAASGLPGAVSRMVAKDAEKAGVLLTARKMVMRLGLLLGVLLLLFSPLIAGWMGDERTLPSLLLFSPCILIIGLSGVYRGYSLGMGNVWPPALCEMTEQVVRLLIVLAAALIIPRLTVAWRAAVPAFATVMGEGCGLLLMVLWLRKKVKGRPAPVGKQLSRAALPVTMNRLCHTALRTLCSVIIPLRLTAAGLSHSEAISRMGMLSGMVMPLIFLPGMFSGALGTVSIPAVAGCRSCVRQRKLMLRLLLAAGAVGIGCSSLLHVLAPFVGKKLYALPEVGELLRAMSPLAAILSVQQVLGGIMMGLGMERKTFFASLWGALITLGLTFLWTADRRLGIYGAGYANLVGHGITLICCLISFLMHEKTAESTASAV